MLLLLALRGNPIIYQGEELGLPQGEIAFEDLRDPEAIANWPQTLGRDGARTPMPWRENAPNAGFSSAAHTWLKCDPAHAAFAVDRQERRSALDPQLYLRAACPAARAPCTGAWCGQAARHARGGGCLPAP
jgi:alpha-glucosidase